MRSPRVTTEAWTAYDESRPLDAVPEAARPAVAEKKLWWIKAILQTDLRVAANYLAELQQFDAWRLFKCGSMAEFVEQRGLRLDDELVAEIRSRLQPAPVADVVEEPAGDESVVDVLRERAFRMAQAGRETARALADTIERIHDYAGPGGWRLATRPDGSKFDTFREYAAYRNPPGLGFNEHDGAANVDAIVSRLIAFDPNRLAIAYLRGKKTGGDQTVSTSSRDSRQKDARSTADVPAADASALLAELKAAGVRVEARGDRLRLLPASAVDDALVARVRPHKSGLLALLEARSRPARRGVHESPEEARVRQTAAIERLRRDREAFVEEARKAGVYRGLATDTGADVA